MSLGTIAVEMFTDVVSIGYRTTLVHWNVTLRKKRYSKRKRNWKKKIRSSFKNAKVVLCNENILLSWFLNLWAHCACYKLFAHKCTHIHGTIPPSFPFLEKTKPATLAHETEVILLISLYHPQEYWWYLSWRNSTSLQSFIDLWILNTKGMYWQSAMVEVKLERWKIDLLCSQM